MSQAENPFFDDKYDRHVLFYSFSESLLPKIVSGTRSFVLNQVPVAVLPGATEDIITGITLIKKPPGCKVVISFHTLPAGIHNWDLCRKHRIEYDTVDSNSIICVRIQTVSKYFKLVIFM